MFVCRMPEPLAFPYVTLSHCIGQSPATDAAVRFVKAWLKLELGVTAGESVSNCTFLLLQRREKTFDLTFVDHRLIPIPHNLSAPAN